MWGGIRIGINDNPDEFFTNLFHEGKMKDYWTKKCPLQTAETEQCGFLYLSTQRLRPLE